jgi:hypothetical protein
MVIKSFQMPFHRKCLARCGVILILAAGYGQAKRLPPKPVAPVIADGVRYSSEGAGGDQYVVAAEVSSGKVLWKVKVFRSHITLRKEIDVQLVFISDLKLVGNILLVRDEMSRCYSVDIIRKRARKQQCNGSFSP